MIMLNCLFLIDRLRRNHNWILENGRYYILWDISDTWTTSLKCLGIVMGNTSNKAGCIEFSCLPCQKSWKILWHIIHQGVQTTAALSTVCQQQKEWQQKQIHTKTSKQNNPLVCGMETKGVSPCKITQVNENSFCIMKSWSEWGCQSAIPGKIFSVIPFTIT